MQLKEGEPGEVASLAQGRAARSPESPPNPTSDIQSLGKGEASSLGQRETRSPEFWIRKQLPDQPAPAERWQREPGCVAIGKRVRWDWNGASKAFHKHGNKHIWCRNPGRWKLPCWLFLEQGLWIRSWRAKVGTVSEAVPALREAALAVMATQTGSSPCPGATPDPGEAPTPFHGPEVTRFHILCHGCLWRTLRPRLASPLTGSPPELFFTSKPRKRAVPCPPQN